MKNLEWKQQDDGSHVWQIWHCWYKGIEVKVLPAFDGSDNLANLIGYCVVAGRSERTYSEVDIDLLKRVAIEFAEYHLEGKEIKAIKDWREAKKRFEDRDSKYELLNQMKDKQLHFNLISAEHL